uniref:Uncharacterized protein n=1 Tax=Anguilla anguilla TaxID=7936 RepID=A0A0E9XUM9_ANGAN
MVIFLSAS